jgi:2'-5' RNA ligase
VRCFIAIDIPPSVLQRLRAETQDLQTRLGTASVRWVHPDGVHLTLRFLGEIAPPKVDAISRTLQQVVPIHAPFRMAVSGVGCFPNLRRPRVIWIGIQEPSGALSALQRGIEDAILGLGFEPERRVFHPHLTLGRVRQAARPHELQAIGAALREHGMQSLGDFPVREVVLYRSELKPTGAVYTKLLQVGLEGS